VIHRGDLFDVLPTLAAESIDACVTDPPYELAFMGKAWDGTGVAFTVATWAEVLRVLKPGAHLVAFGGTRTFHRMTAAIEDAGFEIRDCLSWLYGSGFPKSLNLPGGLGTALKPSWEPCVLARKPTRGTVAQNVAKHGTAALNIEACRIEASGRPHREKTGMRSPSTSFDTCHSRAIGVTDEGRWPANVLLDEEAAALLDEQSGESKSAGFRRGGDLRFNGNTYAQDSHTLSMRQTDKVWPADSGGASRFYYVAKPSREERDMGCHSLPARSGGEATDRQDGSAGVNSPRAGAGRTGGARNIHPTVKPVELMRWLVRLVTPPDGVVLDPFMGSGTTGMACRYEQRRFIGIEREAEYVEIAERRIAAVAPLFGEQSA
jgi:hypothetical protein